jgi:hypothetical protein
MAYDRLMDVLARARETARGRSHAELAEMLADAELLAVSRDEEQRLLTQAEKAPDPVA